MILGVPVLLRYDLLERLFRSAEAGKVRPTEYLIIDNGGKFVPPASHVSNKIGVQRPGKNIGVAASWNRILKYALNRGEPVIVSNDDVELGRDTFEALAHELEQGAPFVSGLGFALFGIRPECFFQVGGFDERFFPAYYEDRDYERRLKLAGVEWQELSVTVRHEGWATSRAMNMEGHFDWYAQNLRRYIEKWGGVPGGEQFVVPYDGGEAPSDA